MWSPETCGLCSQINVFFNSVIGTNLIRSLFRGEFYSEVVFNSGLNAHLKKNENAYKEYSLADIKASPQSRKRGKAYH